MHHVKQAFSAKRPNWKYQAGLQLWNTKWKTIFGHKYPLRWPDCDISVSVWDARTHKHTHTHTRVQRVRARTHTHNCGIRSNLWTSGSLRVTHKQIHAGPKIKCSSISRLQLLVSRVIYAFNQGGGILFVLLFLMTARSVPDSSGGN